MEAKKPGIELTYFKAKISKRSLAFLVDLVIMSVIALGTFVGLRAIMENSAFYVQAFDDYVSIAKNSQLYTYEETEDNLVLIDEYAEGTYEDDYAKQVSFCEERLTYFYVEDPADIFDEGEGLELYNAEKIGSTALSQSDGSPYFALSSVTGKPVAVVDDKTLMGFYEEAVVSAVEYLNRNETFVNASKTLTQTINIALIPISIAVALLLHEFLLPLAFFRRGWQTIGMWLMKLSLVDMQALSPSVKRFSLRFLWMLFVETLASLMTFGVPLFVNVGFAFFRKDGQALHDYMTGTYMVDSSEQSIYLSQGEYLVLQEKAGATSSRASLTTWFDAPGLEAPEKKEEKDGTSSIEGK